jgi:hypothetical protein
MNINHDMSHKPKIVGFQGQTFIYNQLKTCLLESLPYLVFVALNINQIHCIFLGVVEDCVVILVENSKYLS